MSEHTWRRLVTRWLAGARRGLTGPLALTLALAATPAQAVPRAGVDCGCSATGSYLLPAHPVERVRADEATGLSPGGTFRVFAVAGVGVSADVTVTVAATGRVVLTASADDWGFGVRDDEFVVLPTPGSLGPSVIDLYHLTATGAALVRTFDLSAGRGVVSFSPQGNHALSFQLSPLGQNATVTVFDPVTGAERFRGDLTYTQPIATPDPGTMDTIRIGFSPDAGEASFAYWYLSGPSQVTTAFANLQAAAPPTTRVGSAFVLGYSPCGDTLGFVETIPDPLQAGQNLDQTSLYSSASGRSLTTLTTFPVSYEVALVATATQHVAQAAPGTQPPFTSLAANTAGAACPPPGPAVTPSFTLPGRAWTLLPALFTDTTVVPAGAAIISRMWNFGDGATGDGPLGLHTYAAAGTYTVTFTVVDQDGRRSSVSHALAVAFNQPPVVDFTVSPIAPVRRDEITLTDTSTDDDGVVSRSWTVDGQGFSDPTVTVRACGPTLSVDLTVTDGAGQSATRSAVIPLAEPVPPDILVPAGGDIAAAAATACPGDRLQLEAGTYQGGVRLVDVSLRGAGAGASVVEGSGASPDAWVLDLYANGGQTVTVSEVTVRGGGLPEAGGAVNADADFFGLVALERVEVTGGTGHGGIWISSVNGEVRVADASVHHNGNTLAYSAGGGIGMSCCAVVTVDHSELAFNKAEGEAGQGGGAGLLEASGITFTRNDVHDNSAAAAGGGISLEVSRPGVNRVALNAFRGNTTTAPALGAVALRGTSVFAGNLVAGNPAGGVVETGPVSLLTLVDSTVADNGGPGLVTPRDPGGASAAVVWNTILTGNAPDVDGPLTGGGANLISVEAGFVGPGDYHLAAGSPALDAGDTSAVPAELTVDLDGGARIVPALAGGAARVDIGADERPTDQPVAGGGGGGHGAAGGGGGGCGQGGLDGLGLAVLAAVGVTMAAPLRRGHGRASSAGAGRSSER